ncbi:MAG: hypothetical protein ACP5P2_02040 [Candidatus Micrarchaeia archaeon]
MKTKKYLVMLSIVASALFLYLFYFTGMYMGYDDPVYAYSMLYPSIFKFVDSFAGGSLGFFIIGSLFVRISGNSLLVPPLLNVLAILITIVVAFEIGYYYNRLVGGALAAIFYAFNPLTMTYSTRLLPDPFIALFLSISIYLLIVPSGKKYFYFLSGFAAGFTVLYGSQGFISLSAYGIFLISLLFAKGEKKKIQRLAFALAGTAIPLGIYFGMQYALFKDIFYALKFTSFDASLKPYVKNYYLYSIFPIKLNTVTRVAFEPYSNIGLLGFFLAFLPLLYFKDFRMKFLPIAFSSLFFVFYFLFGSQSILEYSPLHGINRLLIPLAFLLSLYSAASFAFLFKKLKKYRFLLASIGIAAYLLFSFVTFSYAVPFNAANSNWGKCYAIASQLQRIFGNNVGNITIYQNVCPFGFQFYYVLGAKPMSYMSFPQPVLNCSWSDTIYVLNSTACGSKYIYGNLSEGYYVYYLQTK